MQIAVTGSIGFLGRAVVAELRNAGHEVRGIDRARGPNGERPDLAADIGNLGQICGALHGCDAVLHLAAIPSLSGQLPDVVFSTNVIGIFNVIEAATLLGIKRAVTISSGSALGVAYRYHDVALEYLPVDEAHPLLPQDAYGLSKQVGEQICSAFHRRTGGTALSLRFPWIVDLEHNASMYAEEIADPQTGMHTLFTYIDVRDAALACRLAIEAEGLTDEAFYVNAPETFMQQPSAELAQRFFPTAKIRGNATGRWALADGSRAEKLLGFRAQHLWDAGSAPAPHEQNR